jgi:DNA modification methylase
VNRLYFGDNLHWLPAILDESVQLIYLDPPFNSKAAYHLLYKSPDRKTTTAQYQAFLDSWTWGPAADAAFLTVMTRDLKSDPTQT